MISPQSGALISLSPSEWDFWPCLPHADADNQSGELLKSFFVNIISKLRPLLTDFNKVVVSQINKHTIFQSLVWRLAESRKGIRICYSLSSKLLFHLYHLWIVFLQLKGPRVNLSHWNSMRQKWERGRGASFCFGHLFLLLVEVVSLSS